MLAWYSFVTVFRAAIVHGIAKNATLDTKLFGTSLLWFAVVGFRPTPQKRLVPQTICFRHVGWVWMLQLWTCYQLCYKLIILASQWRCVIHSVVYRSTDSLAYDMGRWAPYLYSAVSLLPCLDWLQDELNQMSVKHGFSNVPVTKDEVSVVFLSAVLTDWLSRVCNVPLDM